MKAIQTHFKGYHFRSRLEARWAVLFDSLGFDWEYEPEGFELGEAGRYLPDFYVEQLGAWVEVKAKQLNATEREKAFALSSHTNKPVIELCGIPDPDDMLQYGCMVGVRHYYGADMNGIENHWFMQSLVEFYLANQDGEAHAMAEYELVPMALKWDAEYYHKKYGKPHPRNFPNGTIQEFELMRFGTDLYNATIKARSARFEFGQCG